MTFSWKTSRGAAWLAAIRRPLAAWRWGGPLARVGAALLGLVVLAAIGRSAFAGGWPARAPDPQAVDPPAIAASPPVPAPAPAPPPPSASTGPPAAPLLAPPVEAPDAGEAPTRGRATPDDPVFLNQASLSDLRRLPGVGAKRAQAILDLRARLQRFRQIEDLLKVKGIGRASLRKLRPLVRLDLLTRETDKGATPPPP